jgi:Bacterial PH domain
MSVRRFPCSPGGAVLRGRLRLRRLLVGLTLLMIAVAVATWFGGQRWPAVFALLVAGVTWTAWRMSGDLDILWLDLGGKQLTIQMRRRRERFPVAGAEARRLTPEEIEHLERLATTGGVTAGTGGFDSRLLGELDLYASNFAHAVLVDLGENRLVVTPDDPEGLLQALRTALL